MSEDLPYPKIRPGRIRHESLPDEMLEQVAAIFEVIGPYLNTTLEQFEISLMRDMHPADEVAIWASITAAWLAYHEQFLNDKLLSDEEEKKLIGALLVISTGETNAANCGVPTDVGDKLLRCYDELGNQ